MIIWTVLLLCIICDILQRRRFNDEYLIYLLAGMIELLFIEKLRGLLKECLRYIDIWGYTDSHENLLYPQIKVALGESEEK